MTKEESTKLFFET